MQSEGRSTVCRLCLKPAQSNAKAIQEITRHIFNVLLLDLNIAISEGPIMCEKCAESIQQYFDFKTHCLHVENCIDTFTKDRKSEKVDITKLYLSRNKLISIPKGYVVCRLCMKVVKLDDYLLLNDEIKEVILLKMVLEKYFPELDLNITKDPAICTSCHVSLQSYTSFMISCFGTEEKIKKHSEIEGGSCKNRIELNSAMHLDTPKYVMTCKQEFLVSGYKKEDINTDIIKKCYEEPTSNIVHIKQERFVAAETEALNIKLEDVEIKTDLADIDGFNHDLTLPGSTAFEKSIDVSVSKYQSHNYGILCSEDIQESHTEDTEDKIQLKEHFPVYTAISKLPEYKCEICGYNTNGKRNLERHSLVHKDASEVTLYECHTCTFKTKHKGYLKAHILNHKDASNLTMHLCTVCDYKTRYKNNLNKHMLIHKHATDVTIYQCETCEFKTRHKNSLKYHMQFHRDAAGIPTYECDICDYKTKHKSSLKQHLMTHKNESEIKFYYCEECDFKTKHEYSLKRHFVAHKDASEVTIYKCETCPFESRTEKNLKRHLLVHKDEAEVTMYECNVCAFKTKHKRYLREHVKIHKDVSEVKMHQCDLCEFKTRHKNSLRCHMGTHNPLGAKVQCNLCEYRTMHDHNLKQHMLTHEDASKVVVHQCEVCEYTTKYRASLKRHILHKHSSNMMGYQCTVCSFQTKHKASLKRHAQLHKHSLEATSLNNESQD